MSITGEAKDQPLVASLYDWGTGCIVAVALNLVTSKNAAPSFSRVLDNATANWHLQYMTWARRYFKIRPSVTFRPSQ